MSRLDELVKTVPSGHWAALDQRETRVVAHGEDLDEVLAEATRQGELDPVIFAMPETLMLFLSR
jgi:hypothetical protein